MKINHLTHAVSVSLTALALTACGSSDDGTAADIIVPAPTPSVIETPAPTPTPTAVGTNFIELAKAAGLNDANAAAFAETVKNMTVDSTEYKNALTAALKAQADAIIKATAPTTDPVSVKVEKANPFINGVDVSARPTMGSSHYIRHPGSTYERTSNPSEIAGLGTVATDDPTKSNPWLSNYVLGVEAVRGADGTVRAVAIDSAGEMVVADSTYYPDGAKKLGVYNGKQEGYDDHGSDRDTEAKRRLFAANIDGIGAAAEAAAKTSPYYTTYDGLSYSTQRGNGTRLEYSYVRSNGTNIGAREANVRTLQEMNSQHATTPRTTLITNALKAAKDRNFNPYSDNPNPNPPNGKDQPDDAGGTVASGFSDYTRAGLIVYNKDEKYALGYSRTNFQGWFVPAWGIEENAYRLNSNGDQLRARNGVDVRDLSARTQTPAARNAWNNSRYGTAECIAGVCYNYRGRDVSTGTNAFENATPVANNSRIRLFGKNMLGYEAGATGQQINDNSYVAPYSASTGKMINIIPAKLHHVQYGRLTNNIDVITEDSITDKTRVLYRDFQLHGAPNSVDTYFYRGTNHTTMDEMKAIRAAGGTYRYHGHALTYGFRPVVLKVTSAAVPTAYGATAESNNTIGNFVEATFNASTGKVSGSVYNFINRQVTEKPDDFFKQELANFQGDVYGNTVVGTATSPHTPGVVGSLTASFFGTGASELGGQISSISREQGYGNPIWGAVFGATRGTSATNFNVIENK